MVWLRFKKGKLMPLKLSPQWKRRLLRGTGITLLAAAIAIVLLSLWIETTYNSICDGAMREHSGARVNALMACVESEECSYHEKNRALWALGQLGDRSVLPSLRGQLTGKPCDHQRDGLCQGELNEAIEKLDSSQFNLPAFLWRGLLDRLS